jgi:hypothetical protein
MDPQGLPYTGRHPDVPEPTPRLPIETLRDYYVTRFGGFSEELAEGEIGINATALELNTHLERATAVLLMKIHALTRVPLHFRRMFTIVPVDESMPRAFAHTPQGQAVLSPWDAVEGGWREHYDLLEGDEIIINSTPAKWRLPENLLRRVSTGG